MTSDAALTPADAPLSESLSQALEGRDLLTHPFYRRWEAGLLSQDELAEYAIHYRAFEASLPLVLSDVVDQLRDAGEFEPAEMVTRNLRDELGRPEPHLDLFDRFADALTGTPASSAPGPAAQALVQTYADLVAEGPAATLAGLAAYEMQASAIASTKADGLRSRYGLDAAGTEFWDVHAALEADHGDWALEALVALDADPVPVQRWARRGADAWWAFLDEREVEAPVPSGC
jgi:pyrroloquinoline quinone (PQQ) biosynthesis protein C